MPDRYDGTTAPAFHRVHPQGHDPVDGRGWERGVRVTSGGAV